MQTDPQARDHRLPPVAVLLAAAATQRLLAGRRRRTLGALTTAVAIAGASAWLAGSAATRFRRRATTVDPTRPATASTLVTDGANSLTRNPMYVGMAGLLLAHAVARRSWASLVPAAAFVLALDRGQIAAEEQALAARFGPAFADYRAATPRWVDDRSVRAARELLGLRSA